MFSYICIRYVAPLTGQSCGGPGLAALANTICIRYAVRTPYVINCIDYTIWCSLIIFPSLIRKRQSQCMFHVSLASGWANSYCASSFQRSVQENKRKCKKSSTFINVKGQLAKNDSQPESGIFESFI